MTSPLPAELLGLPSGWPFVPPVPASRTVQPVTLLNCAEGGANGTGVTTGNSGGLSGAAFDTVTTGAGATLTYDQTVAAHGGLSLKVAVGSPAANSVCSWTGQLTGRAAGPAVGQSVIWFRGYFYFTALPGAQLPLISAVPGAAAGTGVAISTSGKILTTDSAGSTQTTSATVIPLNTWFRLEGWFASGVTAGQIQVSIYASNMDGKAADETNTTTATVNTNGTAGLSGVQWGNPASVTSYTFWMDDLAASTIAPVGPVIVLDNGAEGGTSGTTVTAGNSGGTSGSAFDTVFNGSGTTVTFDNAQAAHGSLSYKIATTTAQPADLDYVASMVTGSYQPCQTMWFRFYLYFTANPTNNHRIVEFYGPTASIALQSGGQNGAGGTTSGGIILNTAGKIVIVDTFGQTFLASTNAVPLNAWFRVEGYIATGPGQTGSMRYSIYTTADGLVASETHTASNLTVNTGVTSCKIGPGNYNVASVGPFWVDDIGFCNAGALGPSVQAPAGTALSGTGSLTANVTQVEDSTDTVLAGTGSLAAPDVVQVEGTTTLAAAGSISSAVQQAEGTTTLAGTGSLGSPDVVVQADSTATILAGTGSLTPPDVVQAEGTTILAGAGQLAAPDVVQAEGLTALAGTGSLTAPDVAAGAGAALSGAGSVGQPDVTIIPAAILGGAGQLTAPAVITLAGAVLAGAGSLAATPAVIVPLPATTVNASAGTAFTAWAAGSAFPAWAPGQARPQWAAGSAFTAWNAGQPAAQWAAGSAYAG